MKNRVVVFFLLAGLMLAGGNPAYGAPGDVVFEREGEVEGASSFPPAVFPHWVHRAQYRCYACHPALFVMQQGANTITMDSINNGQYCGVCHNGKAAFNVEFKHCARCHKKPED